MDLGTLIALGSLLGAPVLAGLWWIVQKVFGAFSKLGDHDRRLGAIDKELLDVAATQEQHNERLERAEEGVRNINKLADAINHMGETVRREIGHLAEVVGIHNRNNERQFEELNERLGEQSRSFRPNDK